VGERIKIDRRIFDITPTVDTSIYASGDAIDGLQTLTEAVNSADQSGIIEHITLIDGDGQDAALDLLFYEAAVADGTDNAAYAPTLLVLKQSLGTVSILAADYDNYGANGNVATVKPNFFFQMENSQNLFFQIVSRGTPTYAAATNVKLRFIIKAD